MGQDHDGNEPTVRLGTQIPRGLVREAKEDAVMTESGIRRWFPVKFRRQKRRGTMASASNSQMRYM